ncbi:hypothetical protein B0T22DRAFT_535221 [Podospora appendiculata]|uniref:Uncharacterized protein n=1 Tax=Podospora appendiculata TaxID=314037 RepID=A0AAE1CBZ0_9PEZI|nr:hypothetical protein B0T22DRAFT_535221 [Podospora appendiculata]
MPNVREVGDPAAKHLNHQRQRRQRHWKSTPFTESAEIRATPLDNYLRSRERQSLLTAHPLAFSHHRTFGTLWTMRLLEHDDTGGFRQTDDFPKDNIPPYAILSHTWGDEEARIKQATVTAWPDGTAQATYATHSHSGT